MSDTIAQPTFEVTFPSPNPSKSESEYGAFLRLLPELLKTHAGEYVAIHEGKVIDRDANDIALIKRVHGKVGYVPIHVGLVEERPPAARIPHYREVRQEPGNELRERQWALQNCVILTVLADHSGLF